MMTAAPSVDALKRVWWRMGNPDVTREEWAVLHLVAATLGRGRLAKPIGCVPAFDDDLRAMCDFAEKFIEGDPTTRQVQRAWSGVLVRLYHAGLLDRERETSQRAAYGDGKPTQCYRYFVACDSDYNHWWEHPESVAEHLQRFLPQ